MKIRAFAIGKGGAKQLGDEVRTALGGVPIIIMRANTRRFHKGLGRLEYLLIPLHEIYSLKRPNVCVASLSCFAPVKSKGESVLLNSPFLRDTPAAFPYIFNFFLT